MRKHFPAYYERAPLSDQQEKEVWRTCIFTFDTNILLEQYRYSEAGRKDLFHLIEQNTGRIWLPHHVAFEYQRRRQSVIQDQFDEYTRVSGALKDAIRKGIALVDDSFEKHPITTKQTLEKLRAVQTDLKRE